MDVVAHILALEEKRTQAMLAVDLPTLRDLTTEDYVHVESNGRRRTRQEFLDDLTSAVYRFDEFVIDENCVSVSGDTAWAVGRYHNIVRTSAGAAPLKRARHVRIWALRNGSWRNVLHQATEIVAP